MAEAVTDISPRQSSRFVVGIDLGTTNIAVSYVDTARDREVRRFRIPQLIAPGEVDEQDLLPAFCYLPAGPEFPEGALDLPWGARAPYAVGVLAREQGAATPGRLVASAKSWMAHGGVDRTRGILPWGGDLGDAAVSPVAVTAFYLDHLRNAWDARFGKLVDADGTPCRLTEQQVIITVPASFDEAARRLTLQAAAETGIHEPVLLEEPLAAFYDWLHANESGWSQHLGDEATALIVDVGGGTTDFSLVHVESDSSLRRTAVGDHLLLGGDNMDMALARMAEAGWGVRLHARQWSQLCQVCRRAKEALLAEDAPEYHTVASAAPGSSVVGGLKTWTFSRAVVRDTLVDGFFPAIDRDAPGPIRRSGVRQMGLPYVSDPAISRHLLVFLQNAGGGREGGIPPVSHVLFNGGALLPPLFRERLRSVLGQWFGLDGPLSELSATDLRTAVARGAAYYGLVRRGEGVRVHGGAARAYYTEVKRGSATELVCVLPRDTDEGKVVQLTARQFRAITNRPVRFALYASSTRLGDRIGDVIDDREEMTELPPIQTVLVHGRRDRHTAVEVQLNAVLTEIGTLDLWCTTLDGQHRYPLSFDLRAQMSRDDAPGLGRGVTVPEETVGKAIERMVAAFEGRSRLTGLVKEMETILGMARRDWGAALLRRFADWLLDHSDLKTSSPDRETRWLNLAGYCLRPGFGFPGDDWRVRRLWKVWHGGPVHARHAQVLPEWWICWRRAAGGLRAGHHQQIAAVLLRDLMPKGPGNPLGPPKSLRYAGPEMWRCLGAMERVPVSSKLRIFRALLDRRSVLKDFHWWALARLGARRPLYGTEDTVIPASKLESLLPPLFDQVDRKPGHSALFAVAAVCRLCGVRNLDLSAQVRERAEAVLARGNTPEEWQAQVRELREDTSAYQAEFAGDELPLGLDLVEPD